MSYFRTPNGSEVDFVWRRGQYAVGIEVKSSATWWHEYSCVMNDLQSDGILSKCFGVFLGDHAQQDGLVRVLPYLDSLSEVNEGRVFERQGG